MAKKRHPSVKSKATNDPLALVSVNLNTHPGGRRYRDLVTYYQERLGESFKDEEVRVKVLSVIALTIELERAIEGSVAGDGTNGKLIKSFDFNREGHPTKFIYSQSDAYLIGHLTGQLVTLVRSLGLETKVVAPKKVERLAAQALLNSDPVPPQFAKNQFGIFPLRSKIKPDAATLDSGAAVPVIMDGENGSSNGMKERDDGQGDN